MSGVTPEGGAGQPNASRLPAWCRNVLDQTAPPLTAASALAVQRISLSADISRSGAYLNRFLEVYNYIIYSPIIGFMIVFKVMQCQFPPKLAGFLCGER
ncbi:hypothetical protein [Microbaculum marinum]|uniref:Uncharacterized protein n=1 Tax=Microbaculum marinum TaxID=1764581 RepID=A0AAW9RVC5_9HYPH